MTAREARNRRRAEERKQAKLARKAEKFVNPSLLAEFPREFQIQANLVRDRIHHNAGLQPIIEPGFVSQTDAEAPKRTKINRQNAQRSTGPKSPQGKLASSRNSLKHGLASGTIIVPCEDPAAFEALLRDLLEEHQPANTTEDLLIHQMAQSHWLTQRAIRYQNDCFTETGVDEKRLSLFLRYQTTHSRAFHKALNTLMKFKKERERLDEAALLSAPKIQTRVFVSQRRPQSRKNPQFVSQNAAVNDQNGGTLQKTGAA